MMTTASDIDTTIERVFDLLNRNGGETYIGERVTMLVHMLQSAEFAERNGENDDTIVASLLHDIGHFTHDFDEDCAEHDIDSRHEVSAMAVLRPAFPESVCQPVEHHVAAKRYLVATDPDYIDQLSDASILSLKLQGGAMSKDEVTAFERGDFWRETISLRHYDEQGKVVNMPTKPLEYFRPHLTRVLEKHGA